MISTLVILGIVGVVILPRFSNPQSYRDQLFKDQLVSFSRLAQQAALTRNSQQITLELSRPDDWLLSLLVDGAVHTQQQVSRGSGTLNLLSPAAVAIDDTNPLRIHFDNLGNATALSGTAVVADLNANLSFDASGRFFCISRAGYAYEAASQVDCVNN